jgi:hypothetical protein
MNRFRHPANGYEETISWDAPIWVFLFGGFYLLYKGLWGHFLVWLVVCGFFGCIFLPLGMLVSIFIFAPIYMVTIRGILRKSYLKAGWIPANQPPALPVSR